MTRWMRKLSIYLNDHLMGSTVGLELARRAAGSNKGNEYGAFLSSLAAEIAEDRDALLRIMEAHDVSRDRLKVGFAWVGEKLGRLKPNGSLVGYSPLSRLVELEGLTVGVYGKRALWLALRERELADRDELSELVARAERQLEALEQHRVRAASEALA
jgi:hypothetical protein